MRPQEVEIRARKGGEEGLLECADLVKAIAIRNMPVGDPAQDPDPAVALAESIHVEPDPDSGGQSVQVVVRTPYAAKQHEDQRLDHPRGGGAKYLERALLEALPQFKHILAAKVRANMSPQARIPRSRRTR